jgi:PrtD family type I secretion system ABC transporter
MLTIVILITLALLGFLQGIRTFALNAMGAWFEKQLSEKVFTNAVRLNLGSRGAGGSEQIRDLQTIKTFITSPNLLSILDLPWAFVFLLVLFLIHFWMGALTVIGGSLLLWFAFFANKFTKKLHESSNENFITSMRTVDQASRNAEVIKVMGLMPNIIKNWQNINRTVQSAQELVNARQNVISEVTKYIRMILQILVTGIGAYLVLKNEMSTGAIIACSSLSGRALAPFEQAVGSWKAFLNCKQSYMKLQKSLKNYREETEKMSLPAPVGNIAVEGVSYIPTGTNRPILNNINIGFKAGETVIIIGPSGSGKTTLVKVLLGVLKPTSGVVRVDGANIEDWNQDELGQYVGYLPQSVELFSGTIKDNIARMNKEAEATKVIEAAQLANAHDMILRLQKGYDTDIGIDGSILSGGQRQRVGLARSFYGSPKILVLDEPNSNLDTIGEQALAHSLIHAKRMGITAIIISHRPSLLPIADRIIVLQDGAVSLAGSRDEVLNAMNKAAQNEQAGKAPQNQAPATDKQIGPQNNDK